MLVPTKLNGVNYPSWTKSMIHALTAKNKIGFVNGSIQPPSEIGQPTNYALWNQCNNMTLSWLTHSVEPDLAKGGHSCQDGSSSVGIYVSKTNSHKRMHLQSMEFRNP
ncbi:hypothetical protein CK203_065393 [Vitis vinifera]|uniref:Retrotransposon Copia-like N-terminal domain-containing protein n=1 Tax=Vitis vinifera TaxID=29760 RepID=A0A438FNW4_VITVI|nr:hypothetical protein CK203_065393 [Vitis vinifera]